MGRGRGGAGFSAALHMGSSIAWGWVRNFFYGYGLHKLERLFMFGFGNYQVVIYRFVMIVIRLSVVVHRLLFGLVNL